MTRDLELWHVELIGYFALTFPIGIQLLYHDDRRHLGLKEIDVHTKGEFQLLRGVQPLYIVGSKHLLILLIKGDDISNGRLPQKVIQRSKIPLQRPGAQSRLFRDQLPGAV